MSGPCIATSRGMYFDYTEPHRHPFCPVETAHSLSRICRFTGHVGDCFNPEHDDLIYTVAQHCVLVADILRSWGEPVSVQFEGLMHDAHERVTNDLNSPLKSMHPTYKAHEDQLADALLTQVGITAPLHPRVKEADMFAADCERLTFMTPMIHSHARGWWTRHPDAYRITVMGIGESKRAWLAKFKELTECA